MTAISESNGVDAERLGRRAQNKAEKLRRITGAARDLFTQRTVFDVTTSEIAKRAGVAEGTLFLYAGSKGELLLLAQNSAYAGAHAQGTDDSAKHTDPVEAVLALVSPILLCNRHNIPNGRAYLQEVMFGEADSEPRREALALMASTESHVVDILIRTDRCSHERATAVANAALSVLFVLMGSPLHTTSNADQLLNEFESRLRELIPA